MNKYLIALFLIAAMIAAYFWKQRRDYAAANASEESQRTVAAGSRQPGGARDKCAELGGVFNLVGTNTMCQVGDENIPV